jgi:hypothetical protein
VRKLNRYFLKNPGEYFAGFFIGAKKTDVAEQS